jgi:ankyrin repeat protein
MNDIRQKGCWIILFAMLAIQVSIKGMEHAPDGNEMISRLAYAAMFGQTNHLQALLAAKSFDEIFYFIMADCLFYGTGSGNTALHLAAMNGRDAFVGELLCAIHGANQMKILIAMRNRRCFTALDCAAERGLVATVCILLNTYCCDVDDVQSALSVAVENGCDEVANVLGRYYQLHKSAGESSKKLKTE